MLDQFFELLLFHSAIQQNNWGGDIASPILCLESEPIHYFCKTLHLKMFDRILNMFSKYCTKTHSVLEFCCVEVIHTKASATEKDKESYET